MPEVWTALWNDNAPDRALTASSMKGRQPSEAQIAAVKEYYAMTQTMIDSKGAKARLMFAWFEAHPNQPMPEGRREVEALFEVIEATSRATAELERDQQERFKWAANERADEADKRVAAVRAKVLQAGTRLTEQHGESCDCDTCLVVQPLVDAALDAAPEDAKK